MLVVLLSNLVHQVVWLLKHIWKLSHLHVVLLGAFVKNNIFWFGVGIIVVKEKKHLLMLTAWETVMLKWWTCSQKFLGGRKSLHKEKTNVVLIAAVSRFGTCQRTEVRANNENMHLQLFSGVSWCLGQALIGYDPKSAETREYFWWCWLAVVSDHDE